MTETCDPRELLRRSLAQSAEVIAGVRPEQMTLPTPCALFDVRTLIGHMLFAARRVCAAGAGLPIPDDGPAVRGLADNEWAGAFTEVAEAASVWDRPGARDGDIALPFGTFPAPVVATIYAMEQAAHAWDLSRATGAAVALDEGLAEAVLSAAEGLVTEETRGPEPLPFAAALEAAPDAPASDRLAAHLGRRPDWVPATPVTTAREREDLVAALGGARRLLRLTVRDLDDDATRARTTASALCLGGVIKHVTAMERRWARFTLEGASALSAADEAGLRAHAASFVVEDGETLAGLLAAYEEAGRRTDELVRTLPDLDAAHPLPEAPWFEPGASWSARAVLLHIVAETAQHAGHADILRESLDGARSMG